MDSVKKANALDRGRGLCLQSQKEKEKEDEQGNDKRGNDTTSSSDQTKTSGGNNNTVDKDKDKDEDEDEDEDEDTTEQLRVMVQVNTSGEESKSGCDGDATVELCRHIINNCPNLRLQGLMTIGAIARSLNSGNTAATTENEDFSCLRKVRDRVLAELDITDQSQLELSMGMSNDFESAIVMGSDEVRIGSTIFGERPPKHEAKILEDTSDEKS